MTPSEELEKQQSKEFSDWKKEQRKKRVEEHKKAKERERKAKRLYWGMGNWRKKGRITKEQVVKKFHKDNQAMWHEIKSQKANSNKYLLEHQCKKIF